MVVQHKIRESVSTITVDYVKTLGPTWTHALRGLIMSDYMDDLQCFIRESYRSSDEIYPRNPEDVFKALKLTPLNEVKAVIFADTPFPSVHANGLAFGSFKTARGLNKLPQTFAIEKAIAIDDVTLSEDFDPTMVNWAEKGVLMLNTALITNKDQDSKYNLVSKNFIREIVKVINEKTCDCVFAFTSTKQAQDFSGYMDLTFNHMLLYRDGIDEKCSIFDDINIILETQAGLKKVIQW